MVNSHELVDSYQLNARFRQILKENIFPAFSEPLAVIAQVRKDRATIDANRNLSSEGKVDARRTAAQTARDAIRKWHEARLAGLDADIAAHRAALVPSGDAPDPKRVEFMLNALRSFTPDEIVVLHGGAADPERRVIEAASELAGRVPFKTEKGIGLRHLIAPEVLQDAIAARAATTNPQGVERLNELIEIRGMHKTLANHALAEVEEVLGS